MHFMITNRMMYVPCRNLVLNRFKRGKNRQNSYNLTEDGWYISGCSGLDNDYLIMKLDMGTVEIIPLLLTSHLPYLDKN